MIFEFVDGGITKTIEVDEDCVSTSFINLELYDEDEDEDKIEVDKETTE